MAEWFGACCDVSIARKILLHIATHDARLIDSLAAYIKAQRTPRSAYEYAMLYGIQEPLQQRLVVSGRRLRVLISYGEYWFPWYMRRLAERPANLLFVVKNLLPWSSGSAASGAKEV